MKIEGRWRIGEMELWDREAIELLGGFCFHMGDDSSFNAVRDERSG